MSGASVGWVGLDGVRAGMDKKSALRALHARGVFEFQPDDPGMAACGARQSTEQWVVAEPGNERSMAALMQSDRWTYFTDAQDARIDVCFANGVARDIHWSPAMVE
jgi:hypothetical protein